LGEEQSVGGGGFSFRPVVGYQVTLKTGQATLISTDGTIIFSLAGGSAPSANAIEGVMDRLMAGVSEEFEEFEAGEPFPITVDDSRGLAADVTGELIGKPITGRMAVVAPAGTQIFYAFAFTVEGPEGDRWRTEGNEVFEAVIESVDFFDPAFEEQP
jgi:hypothetical protein